MTIEEQIENLGWTRYKDSRVFYKESKEKDYPFKAIIPYWENLVADEKMNIPITEKRIMDVSTLRYIHKDLDLEKALTLYVEDYNFMNNVGNTFKIVQS